MRYRVPFIDLDQTVTNGRIFYFNIKVRGALIAQMAESHMCVYRRSLQNWANYLLSQSRQVKQAQNQRGGEDDIINHYMS